MNVTNNLKLPQYTEEDIFDLQDINKAYSNIDNAYKEVIDFKNEIPKTNATAEVINARGGKETLGERLNEFGSQLEHNTKELSEKINDNLESLDKTYSSVKIKNMISAIPKGDKGDPGTASLAIDDTVKNTSSSWSGAKIDDFFNVNSNIKNLLPLSRENYEIGQVKGNATTEKYIDTTIKSSLTTGLIGVVVEPGRDIYVSLLNDFKMNLLELDENNVIRRDNYITTSQKLTLRSDTNSIIFNVGKIGNPKLYGHELEDSCCGVYTKMNNEFIVNEKDLAKIYKTLQDDIFKQLKYSLYNKNIISTSSEFWSQNTTTRILSNEIDCYPNALLYINFNSTVDKDIAIIELDGNGSRVKDSGWITESINYKLQPNTEKFQINCRYKNNGNITPYSFKNSDICISLTDIKFKTNDDDKEELFDIVRKLNIDSDPTPNTNLIQYDSKKWYQGMYSYVSGSKPTITYQTNRLVMHYDDLTDISVGDTVCVNISSKDYKVAIQAIGTDFLQKHDSGWITDTYQYTYTQPVSKLLIVIARVDNSNIAPNDINFVKAKVELGTFTDFSFSNKDITDNLIKNEIHPLFSKNEFRLIAHRGAYLVENDIPENSTKAFENAGKLGFWGIETDISETSDNQFVVMHDDTVDRTTNGAGTVGDMTFEEIRKLTLLNSLDGEILRVPTFKEYLLICKKYGAVPVIEMKNVKNIELFFNEIKAMGFEETCTVISFDIKGLIELRRLSDKIHIQFLLPISKNNINYCKGNKHTAINCGVEGLTEELVRYAHEQNVLVFTNTINDKSTVMSHFNMLVDGVTSDTIYSIID